MKIILLLIMVFISDVCISSSIISKPINEEVYFYHYTRDNPENPTELTKDISLDPKINRQLPWKFFIHGWTTSPTVSPWFHTGKAAYFENGDYNVVFVDWSKPANQSFIASVISAIEVGSFFGRFIVHLNENGVLMDNIHLLGHSLGAHMAAFAGKYINKFGEKKIGRITGLDPAGPFYESNGLLNEDILKKNEPGRIEAALKYNPDLFNESYFLVPENLRLSKGDANFVDIIHTDALHYGLLSSIGDVDFFPNGGKSQPGCENTTDDNCSHAKSVEFFVESINLNNFVAAKCESYEDFLKGNYINNTKAVLGEHTDHKTKGNFYLRTNTQPPFGKGDL